MFKVPEMKASDFTCMLCGSKLGLKLDSIKIGDNQGSCKECGEPYKINLTRQEMAELASSEKK